jgi:hypothetical protein
MPTPANSKANLILAASFNSYQNRYSNSLNIKTIAIGKNPEIHILYLT